MREEDITVGLRLNRSGKGKAKAFADVTIALDGDGVVKIHGYSIYQDGSGNIRMAPPARPGASRYYDVVTLVGRIQALVEQAISAEYLGQSDEAGA
jgi:hypothetical protein